MSSLSYLLTEIIFLSAESNLISCQLYVTTNEKVYLDKILFIMMLNLLRYPKN